MSIDFASGVLVGLGISAAWEFTFHVFTQRYRSEALFDCSNCKHFFCPGMTCHHCRAKLEEKNKKAPDDREP